MAEKPIKPVRKPAPIADGTPFDDVKAAINKTRGGWEAQPDYAFADLWNNLDADERSAALAALKPTVTTAEPLTLPAPEVPPTT